MVRSCRGCLLLQRRLTVSCPAAQGWTGEMDFIDGVRISAEDMRKTLQGDDAEVLVAQHKEQRLAGCIKVEQLDNGDAEMGMLAVDPALQSCGLGSALLDAARHFAEEVLGAKETCMMVLDNRLDILAWYQARGYVITDEKVFFTLLSRWRARVGGFLYRKSKTSGAGVAHWAAVDLHGSVGGSLVLCLRWSCSVPCDVTGGLP
jgi:N-acetylglutamate synthase-like GNAT family acetyltransferase